MTRWQANPSYLFVALEVYKHLGLLQLGVAGQQLPLSIAQCVKHLKSAQQQQRHGCESGQGDSVAAATVAHEMLDFLI